MTLFFSEFSKLGFFFIFATLLAIIIIFCSFCFSIYDPDTQKVSTYECGFDPYEDARNTFDIRFYLVAILFIIFDLETVYFFPWCISLSFLDFSNFWCILDFIIELLIGLIYIWQIAILNWE